MDFNYALLAKYLVDELSPDELEEVMKWRSSSDENEKIYSEVFRLRLSWKTEKYADENRIETALMQLNIRIGRTKRFRLIRTMLKYAAVILLLVSFSFVNIISEANCKSASLLLICLFDTTKE